jgi:PAS domain S-box-containing protein
MNKNLKIPSDEKTLEEIRASFPESNPNPVIEIDSVGKIYYLNPAAKKLFPDLESKKSRHPYLTNINSIYERLKNSKNKHFTREIKADNIWLDQEFHLAPGTNKIRIYGLDITKRKTIEDNLRESENMLKKTQQIAHIGTWSLEFGSKRPYWSEETYRIYGYNPEKFTPVNDAFDRIVHPDDRKTALNAYFDSIREGKSSYSSTFRIINQLTGKTRIVYEKTEHIRDKSGKVVRSIGMVQDITERKKAEEELQKLNRILKSLNSSSKIMIKADDEIKYLNDVCNIVLKDCGYTMVWIGYAQDDKYKSVLPVAYAGFDKEYVDGLKVTWSDTIQGRGPTGTAIRTGKLALCRNMLADPTFVPWRKAAIKRGYASSISLPLMTEGKAFGSIAIYSHKPDPFSGDEIELLSELSHDLSHGITAIRLRNESKRTEEALRQSEERFSKAFRSSPAALSISRLNDGTLIDINESFENLFGYNKKELIGQRAIKLNLYSNLHERNEIVRQLRELGSIKNYEVSARTKNGTGLKILISAVKNTLNNQDYIIWTAIDISELKKLGILLQNKSKENEAIINSVPAMVFYKDKENRFVSTNKAFENAMGLPKNKLEGKSIFDLYPKEQAESYWKDDKEVIQSGKAKRNIMEEMETDKGTFILQTDKIPYFDEQNNIVGIIGFSVDITERKNLEQRKDDFITIAGHELRTPVSAIKLITQILQEMLADNPQALKYLGKINRQSNIQANLINDLLNVSKIQTGKMEIRKEKFSLQNLAEEVAETMQKTTQTHKIIIKGKIHDKIYTDRDRISQILTNFCSNAIKYSPKGGRIVVRLKKNKNEAIVSVTDHGIGIQEKNYRGIFKRFYRVYGSGSEGYPGLGMGLYISYQLIKLLNGSMWFKSGLGKGSTFYFSLPLA